MGLQYDSVSGDATIEKRMTVDIVGTTESSSGITFGAKLRIRSNEGGVVVTTPTGTTRIGAAGNGARVFLQTNGFELAMGNINGAIDSMPGIYSSEVGLTALADAGVVVNTVAHGFVFDGYSSTGVGAEGIEAIYTAGAFTGHVSYSEPTLSGGVVTVKHAAAYGAYTFNDWTVALGAQKSSLSSEDLVVLTVGGKVGDYGVGFAAADNDGTTKIALNGSATFGATTVNGFVADDESGTDTALGLGVSYDLGGAAVVGGIEHDAVGVNRADLGVSFSF